MKTNVCFYKDHGRITWIPDIKNFRDAVGLAIDDGEGDIIDRDEEGNPLPGNKWKFETPGGSVLLEGRDEIEAETGYLDLDGDLKRLYVVNEPRNEDEAWAIYKEYRDMSEWSQLYHRDQVLPAMEVLGLREVKYAVISDAFQYKDGSWSLEVSFYDGDTAQSDLVGTTSYSGDMDEAIAEARDNGIDEVTARKSLERWMPLLDNIFDY